jgi:asparagine synthase (glutamine-hydrolysing)
MGNEDGSVWTVFNGEIYNHRELRHNLQMRGHIFKGSADTEVIPHLYEEHGVQFVEKLRGMFAVAVYDTGKRRLILARDRFGIKPLFYATDSERLAFASEINALLGLPDVDDRPDRQAIYDFAALLYIPAPETFYNGIRALEPGQVLMARLDDHRITTNLRMYHRWTIAPDPALTLEKAIDRADELVTTAVRRQLESDVPLGSLLSGGIDSSLISVAAQQALGGALRTFNVQFPEKQYDETWAARSVAEHIKSDHRTLQMDGIQGSWEHITDLLLHAGQPFADTSIFAVNAVCRLMRQHVTVALSGDGGDEAFGGYNYYSWIPRVVRWQMLPATIWRGTSVALTPLAHVGIVPDRLPRQMRDLAGADDTQVLQNLFCWRRKDEHQRLCLQKDLLPVRRLFEPQWQHHLPAHVSRLERLSAQVTEIGTRLTLANDYLFKVDTASMRESLEVRVPMLDEDLFAFGLSLPHSLKVSGDVCKTVLRGVADRRLAADVASKRKQGFGVPVDTWVDVEFRKQLRESLLSSSSGLSDFFRREVYRPMVEAFCEARPCPGVSRQDLYHYIIGFLSLQLTLERPAGQRNLTSRKEEIPWGRPPVAAIR